jgi:hypothetical protein
VVGSGFDVVVVVVEVGGLTPPWGSFPLRLGSLGSRKSGGGPGGLGRQ